MLNRRELLIGSLAGSLYPFSKGCQRAHLWEREAYRKLSQSRVAILPAKNYEIALKNIVISGLKLFNLSLRGKRIVLKPNLVEYDPAGGINTHPAVIAGAIEAFKTLGAREVVIAEGPGHRRDNEYLVTASDLLTVLKDHKVAYVDLNHDDTKQLKLRSHFTNLGHLYFPETVCNADLLVSMPKLKTHHWAGVTLSMKNMFGLVPGALYGWPKNILHWSGITESILDINASLPIPQFAIVDGIVGMEGNGPIQGKPKQCGVLIFGEDLPAVDATAARVMKIEPSRISYLEWAGRFLGNIEEQKIVQIAESIEPYKQNFDVIQSFAHLKSLTG